MAEIKSDIFTAVKKLRSLQTTANTVLTKGLWRYAFPSDFSSPISLTLMSGDVTGTAQAGAAGTITLAAAFGYTEDWIQGKEILITSGTGIGGLSQCTAFNTTTKVATMTPNWPTTPDATSTYMIIESYWPLREGPLWSLEENVYITGRGRPREYRRIGDSDDGEFIVTPIPEETYYGLKLRYYADLTVIDLAGDLMTTLYNRWRNVWVMGIRAKCLDDDDDERADKAISAYKTEIQLLSMREQYGQDISNLSTVIYEE